MARLIERTRGKSLMFEIRFYVGGQCKTIPLGKKYTPETARELTGIVETLLRYKDNGVTVLDKRTQVWIETASPEIREKLAKAGLIVLPPSHTLRELWDSFLAEKDTKRKAGKMKDATLHLYTHVCKRFFLFFDPNEQVEDLTQDRMQRWKNHLLEEVAVASVACFIKQAKACFTWAVKQGWIEKSPLDGVGKGSFVNKKNIRIIPMDVYRRMLDACPCQDWRVIIALSRIGGLRCPSEVLELRWEDVNWEHNRFFVRSPKTEQHEGKESRLVPLFPELKEELEALFFNPASEGREFVINRYRDTAQNLRTTLEKIVIRAGLEMFPQPFRNLGRTRSNEVERRWGKDRESAWIGHSFRVWEKHYSADMDDDFKTAAEWTTSPDTVESPTPTSGRNRPSGDFPPLFPPARVGNTLHGAEKGQRAKHR